MSKAPIIECVDLCKRFEQGPISVEALSNINLKVEAGERIAILGKSGSGKTTLLHMLGGLDSPSQGLVKLNGQDFSKLNRAKRGRLRNRHIGFVYQFHHLLMEFTALENVAMPLLIGGSSRKKARQAASEMLDRVGLDHRKPHKPAEAMAFKLWRMVVSNSLFYRLTLGALTLLQRPFISKNGMISKIIGGIPYEHFIKTFNYLF